MTVVEPITVKWKEIEPMVIAGVDENSPGTEFIKLDYNTRTLYLDDVSSDKGFYLIGVQFVRANGGVRIAAQFTPYNELSLVLNKEPTKLNISDVNRMELNLDSWLSQDLSQVHSHPISVQNRDYVKFQPSDIETDPGRTTVPFLDVQAVQTIPPTALGGFGIYLKGRLKFGNFVRLKLLSPK